MKQLFSRYIGVLILSICPVAAQTVTAPSMERIFEQLRNSPPELYAFLLRMPKGADLHNHLAGAVYAETFLAQAAAASFCVNEKTIALTPPASPQGSHCGENEISAAQAEQGDVGSALIDSLSMRNFVPGRESPHDHFFDTFDKFGLVSHGEDSTPEYLSEAIRRAADQNESYMELMALSASGAISKLGTQTGLGTDFEGTRQKLLQAGLEQLVTALDSRVDELERDRVKVLGCDAQPDSAPCRVVVRYILQILRGSPKEQVFAQTLAGFMLAARDPRLVAINFVQPEDGFTSMHDYHLQMQMIAYGRSLYPKVHLSLHAGELASGLVPPEGLRFHIREAVEIAHAERIGHGVDIMYETDSTSLLRTMKERRIAVEINLTSNDLILGVKGKDHPFPIYRKYGVPVTISTDDEGVSRTHMTQEYQRAVLTYGLSYADVKQIVRNGIEYSFLPGASYWKEGSYRIAAAPCAGGIKSASCQTLIKSSDKARLQVDLEQRFDVFERAILKRQ